MSTLNGRVTNVYIGDAGSELTADAALGSASITVQKPQVFNESGGSLQLNGTTHTYTSVNNDTGVISGLNPTTPAAAVTGDSVYVMPRGATKWALIDLDDDDQGVRAMVPFSLFDRLEDGIRDAADEESVWITDERGIWEVKSIGEEIPVIDGSFIAKIITGATLQNAFSGQRIVITGDESGGIIKFYSGKVDETLYGYLNPHVDATTGKPGIWLGSPKDSVNDDPASILVMAGKSDLSVKSTLLIYAEQVSAVGDVKVFKDLEVVGAIVGLGRRVNAMDFGNKTGTTDANGEITINHNLGVEPVAITFGGNTVPGNRGYHVNTKSSTSFVVRVKASDGTAVVSSAVDFFWHAVA